MPKTVVHHAVYVIPITHVMTSVSFLAHSHLLFQEEMKHGHISSLVSKVLFLGAAGSGKTSSKHIILNETPPALRISTPCAERPVKIVRIEVDGLKLRRLQAKGPPLRELLEGNQFCLSHSKHMMDLVPFILQDECSRTRSEVQGKYISIIFDGTTRLGEVLVVVLRYIEAWEIHQRLVCRLLAEKLECRRVSSTDTQFVFCYTRCWIWQFDCCHEGWC